MLLFLILCTAFGGIVSQRLFYPSSADGSFSDDSTADRVSQTAQQAEADKPGQEVIQQPEITEQQPKLLQKDAEDEKWKKVITVTPQQVQENILGYSLLLPPPGYEMYYEQDMPYLVDEAAVGNGVFVSEYLCETEVFLGELLRDVLDKRGEVSDENRKYFTDWALQQLEKSEWERLNPTWEINAYAYDRHCRSSRFFGKACYEFDYTFYADKAKTQEEESNIVSVSFSVDGTGMIYEIQTDISELSAKEMGVENWIQTTGLCDERFRENVILDGHGREGKMVWDFERYHRRFLSPDESYEQSNEGLIASGDAALSAERTGKLFIDILETHGEGIEQYEGCFGPYSEAYYEDLKNREQWEELEENWTASEKYDCVFTDNIEWSGYAEFQYCFYPDYAVMQKDAAKAVIIDCSVNVDDGKISYVTVKMFPMTEKEYENIMAAKAENLGECQLVEKGKVLANKEKVTIPIPTDTLFFMPISKFQKPAFTDSYDRKEESEIWGFTDAALAADFLGGKLLADLQEEQIEKGGIIKLCACEDQMRSALNQMERFGEEDWKPDNRYDCYYIRQNEAAGCMHLKYYFYPEVKEMQTSGRVMVLDVWLSKYGIENIQLNELRCRLTGGLTEEEKNSILQSVYGDYRILEFLPAKFSPVLDADGDTLLPEEEAEMMLDREVFIRETVCRFYDNFRRCDTETAKRPRDEYLLKTVYFDFPDYQLERRQRNEICGLKDDMLPEELAQEEYLEIDLYSFQSVEIPRLYLLEDGRIIMFSMGEYFLLQKIDQGDDKENAAETEHADTEKGKNIDNVKAGKEYFFQKDHTFLTMQAEFDETDRRGSVIRIIEAEVSLVKKDEKGSVYRFAIKPVEEMEELGAERLNLYFYVTDDKIYRLWPYVFENGKTVTFYDDEVKLTQVLDTDQKLADNGDIVCQRENMIWEPKPGQHGVSFHITNNGDTIVYSASERKANGDQGYGETFVWERGKGLTEYRSNYHVESEILYLTNIKEIHEPKANIE